MKMVRSACLYLQAPMGFGLDDANCYAPSWIPFAKNLEFTAHGERDLCVCNRGKCMGDVKVKGLIEVE